MNAPVLAARHSPEATCRARTPARHAHAVLAYYVDGMSRMQQRSEWRVEAGDVLVVPAGEPHRMVAQDRPTYWGAAVDAACFADPADRGVIEPFARVRAGAAAVVRIPAARQAYLEALFRELAEARTAPFAVQRSLLSLVTNEVTRAARWEPAAAGQGGIVATSLAYIEQHCLGALTLQEVAAAVGRTPAYVTTALSRATGKSCVQWIIVGRLAEARRRLLHTDERVEAIAERVGYADATHFIRLFQREHGATPAAWRRAQRSA